MSTKIISIYLLIGFGLFLTNVVFAQDFLHAIPIASKGITTLTAKNKNYNVSVKIATHEIENGVQNKITTHATENTSCTNSRIPCSVVDYINIIVNGKQLVVPRSVYCDLGDLDRGSVVVKYNVMEVKFWAGDAAEAYRVWIDFNNTRVTRKRILSPTGNQVIQDTKYYLGPIYY